MISLLITATKGRILAISKMQKFILVGIFLIDLIECLFSMEQGIIGKQIDGLCVIQLQFFLDDHDEFEDGETFKDEYSMISRNCTCYYRILSACFALPGLEESEFCQGEIYGSFRPTYDGLHLTFIFWLELLNIIKLTLRS